MMSPHKQQKSLPKMWGHFPLRVIPGFLWRDSLWQHIAQKDKNIENLLLNLKRNEENITTLHTVQQDNSIES